jgi:hypothetical protein
VQPIQEKIFNSIQDMAVTRNYAFIFDKASGTSLLFADSKFDISDDVLDEIGTVMQTVRRESRTRPTVQLGGTQSTTGTGTTAQPGQMVPQQKPSQGTTGNTGEKEYSGSKTGTGDTPVMPPPGEKKPR